MLKPFRLEFVATAILCIMVTANARAAGPEAANQTEEAEDAPTPAPLTVGSMALASDPNLAVEAMAVDVSADRVTYSYRLRNKGKDKLSLAASVAMPDLEVNSEGNNVYELPSYSPVNPVNLAVKANDQLVGTTAHLEAIALGVDRQDDLKAAGIPLVPFGDATEKAIAAAKPETLAKLESLGLVTPRDAAQPDAPVIGDWSLRVVHSWMQALDPGAVTNVTVGFSPVKAIYHIDQAGLPGFDAVKEQICLTPAAITAARNFLKSKDAQGEVLDITVANDGPARWLDNPAASVAVRKPQPNSLVVFCGMDPASAGKPVVTGKMPGSNDAAGLRVMIFTPAAPGK